MSGPASVNENRAARQRAWRDVNGNIAELADRLTSAIADTDRGWTFMCECGDADCREMLTVGLGAYRAACLSEHFLVAPGHHPPTARVVERHDDYVVVTAA
jgi:hypothetical protein